MQIANRRVIEIILLLFLVVAAFAAYANSFGGPFVFDDLENIRGNQAIRAVTLSPQELTRAAFKSPKSTRPLPYATFAFNYFFHEYQVTGYHLVNLLLHIATGIILYFFTQTTLGLFENKDKNEFRLWVPFFTALIWLVNPLMTQSVTYVVQRMNILATLFYLLSLLLYARARKSEDRNTSHALFAGAFLSGILALGSKEMAASLPLFLFVYEWFFFQEADTSWLKKNKKYVAILLACSAISVISYLGFHPLEGILSGYQKRDFTLLERLLTESRVVIFYLSLLLFPHPSRLNLAHDFALSTSLLSPVTTLLSILFLTAASVLAFTTRKKHRLLSFCILWYLGNLLIESSVIGLEIIFEHRAYLPSTMIVFLMVYGLGLIPIRKAITGALIAAAVVSSFWTFERNKAWQSSVSLWQDAVTKSPGLIRTRNNLGLALALEGRFDEALGQFLQALAIAPGYAEARISLGVVLKRQGVFDEAEHQFQLVLQQDPDNAKAHNNLGTLDRMHGNIEDAIAHYSAALRADPYYGKAHYNMANALMLQGRLDDAITHYSEAVRLDPELSQAREQMKAALLQRKSRSGSNQNR